MSKRRPISRASWQFHGGQNCWCKFRRLQHCRRLTKETPGVES